MARLRSVPHLGRPLRRRHDLQLPEARHDQLLVQVPNPHYAALIRRYDQLAEFIRVHSSDLAVMLLLIVLGDVVDETLLLSICLADHDLPIIKLELKHL